MQRGFLKIGRWPVAIGLWLAAIALAFRYIDEPLARLVHPVSDHVSWLQSHLGSPQILFVESAIIVAVAVIGIWHKDTGRRWQIWSLACATSIACYVVNSWGLKVLFGVPAPIHVQRGEAHAFHFLAGSLNSGFPSGHMVLASAFAGVFIHFYRASAWQFAGLLLIGASLLVAGYFHFLSDVIAGCGIGLLAGMAVARRWEAGRQG